MRAGWYRCPDRTNTIGYWDGDDWTGEYQPSMPVPEVGVLTIAWGIVAGVFLTGAVSALVAVVLGLGWRVVVAIAGGSS